MAEDREAKTVAKSRETEIMVRNKRYRLYVLDIGYIQFKTVSVNQDDHRIHNSRPREHLR